MYICTQHLYFAVNAAQNIKILQHTKIYGKITSISVIVYFRNGKGPERSLAIHKIIYSVVT